MASRFKSEAEAIEALNYSFVNFEAAFNYLKGVNPNHPMLEAYKGRNVDDIKSERALAVIREGVITDDFWAASAYLEKKQRHSRASAEMANRADQAMQNENNINIPAENSEAVERNQAYLTQKFAEYEEKDKDGNPKWHALTAEIRGKLYAVDDNNKNNSPELQRKTEETIWETTKAEIFSTRAFDFDFMKLNEAQKADQLKEDIADVYTVKAAKIVGVGAQLDEKEDENAEFIKLAKARAAASLKAINDFLEENNSDKLYAKQSAVIASAVHSSKKLDNVVAYAESKNYSKKSVAGFKLFGNKFSEKMKTFWGKAYSGAKEYINNNRERLVVDAVATTVVALSPVTYPVVGAYALYATIGAGVWPIVEKKNKMKNALRRQGKSTEGLSGFGGLTIAWAEIEGDDKEWKRYKNRAVTGAAAGIVVGGLVGAGATHLIREASAMATKAAATVVRSASSVTSQAMNYFDARKMVKEEDNAENRANLNSSKWGLIIGGAIAAIGAAFGIHNLMNSDAPEVDTNGLGGKGGKPSGLLDEQSGSNAAKGAAKGAAKVADTRAAVEEAATSDITVPTQWNDAMGITSNQWNEMQSKITGIFKDRAEIFGMDNKDNASTWQNIYNNIHNAQENGALPKGMTTESIMYKYMKLIENTERVERVPGTKFFRTMLDADNKPMYHVDAEQMAALNDIILCGKKVNVSVDDLTKSLNRITDNGVYVGEGAGIGVTNNRFVGFGRGEDCPDGTKNVNAWESGRPRTPKVKPEVKIEAEPTPEVEKPVEVDNVKVIESADHEVDKITISDNATISTTSTDKGMHDLTEQGAQDAIRRGTVGTPIRGTTRIFTPKEGNAR